MDCALISTFILAMMGVVFVITGVLMQFITNWQLKAKVAEVRKYYSFVRKPLQTNFVNVVYYLCVLSAIGLARGIRLF